jgi:photosystem II stability/assembly factor-like uncharacterized protein
MRSRLLLLPLLALVVVALLLQSRTGADTVAKLAQVEAAEEERELTEPSAAMLARQFSGVRVDPVAAYASARVEAIADAAETRREAPAAASERWELVGPTNVGGRVLDVVLDPEDDQTVYAATASGGVFKSTDGGRRFASAWPDDETQAIGALAIGPDGRLWAGTGEAGPGGGSITYGGRGVFTSDNGGKTWKHVGLERSARIGRVVVDPKDPDRIWVAASGNLFVPGGQRGLFRTDNGGKTWQKVLEGANATTGAVDVAVAPDGKTVFAAMWDHRRGPNEHTYFGVGSGLFRSTDGGTTWARTGGATLAQSPTLGRIGVAVAESDPRKVYAIAQNRSGRQLGLVTSTDGGSTWSFRPDANLVNAGASFAWWFGRIYVDPTDANDLFVMGVGLVRSRDGGATTTVNSRPHADQHGMVFSRDTPDLVYLGNDGGVYRSEDGGATYTFAEYQPWSQLYSVDVSDVDTRRQVAGLQDNGSNRSYLDDEEIGADKWNGYVGGDGLRTLIKPGDPQTVYGCSQYGGCAVSRNGGSSTSSFAAEVVSARKNWFTPIEFDPEDPATVYTGGEIMSRSTNDAADWRPISLDLSNGPQPDPDPDYRSYGSLTTIGPAGKSTGVIWAGTDDGNLWVTKDGAATPLSWQKITAPNLPKGTWITRVQPDPRAPKTTAYVTYSGFRSGEGGHVFRTADGGATWTDVSGDLPNAPVNDINVIGDLLVVASDLGVYASADGGEEWRRIGKGLPLAPVHELKHVAQTGELFAATFGRSLYKIDLPDASALR